MPRDVGWGGELLLRARKAWERLGRQENLKEEKGKSQKTGGRGGVGQWGFSSAILSSVKLLSCFSWRAGDVGQSQRNKPGDGRGEREPSVP